MGDPTLPGCLESPLSRKYYLSWDVKPDWDLARWGEGSGGTSFTKSLWICRRWLERRQGAEDHEVSRNQIPKGHVTPQVNARFYSKGSEKWRILVRDWIKHIYVYLEKHHSLCFGKWLAEWLERQVWTQVRGEKWQYLVDSGGGSGDSKKRINFWVLWEWQAQDLWLVKLEKKGSIKNDTWVVDWAVV